MKYYILFGPPGAGKGTQASAMVEKYNLCHLSTGELLRKEIAEGTELGKKAKSLIDAGSLVPDEVVEGMIDNAFKSIKTASFWTASLAQSPRQRHWTKCLQLEMRALHL